MTDFKTAAQTYIARARDYLAAAQAARRPTFDAFRRAHQAEWAARQALIGDPEGLAEAVVALADELAQLRSASGLTPSHIQENTMTQQPQQTYRQQLAALAYAAYGESVGGKNFLGEPMPTFDALPEKVKAGWEAASVAVAKKGMTDVLEETANTLDDLMVATIEGVSIADFSDPLEDDEIPADGDPFEATPENMG